MTPKQKQFATDLAGDMAPMVNCIIDEYTDKLIEGSSREEIMTFFVERGRYVLAMMVDAGVNRETSTAFAVMVVDVAMKTIKMIPKDVSAKIIARRLRAQQ